jgi:phosphatidylglycerophosphatase A
MSLLARLLATWFYCGHFPKGPGTAGSLGSLAVAGLIYSLTGAPPWTFAVLAAALFLPAVWAAHRAIRSSGSKDPQFVVVDEVIGQWIALAGAPALDSWRHWVAAFLLFRALDIFKPPPVRALENLPGAAGVVLDDVMAGAYAALVLAVAGWFNR